MTTEQIINDLKNTVEELKIKLAVEPDFDGSDETINSIKDKIAALEQQIAELELSEIDEIPFQEMYPRPDVPQQASEQLVQPINSVVSKLQSRPTEELIGMAKNRRKELESELALDNTGDVLRVLIGERQKAQEKKHEFTTAYADVLTQKKEIDAELLIATRILYGALAHAFESGEIKLTAHRKNENGDELDSWVMPSWLPQGLDVQNDHEITIGDFDKLMREIISYQLWQVVSIDETKLERYLVEQQKLRDGKNTRKFADPFQLSAIVQDVVKPVVGKEADWKLED